MPRPMLVMDPLPPPSAGRREGGRCISRVQPHSRKRTRDQGPHPFLRARPRPVVARRNAASDAQRSRSLRLRWASSSAFGRAVRAAVAASLTQRSLRLKGLSGRLRRALARARRMPHNGPVVGAGVPSQRGRRAQQPPGGKRPTSEGESAHRRLSRAAATRAARARSRRVHTT